VRVVRGDRSRILIRKMASFGVSPVPLFPVLHAAPDSTKTLKIVVRMQHTRRTFIETVRTPKKAAHACLFCFTIATPQTTVCLR
jgi:hypothetical protein